MALGRCDEFCGLRRGRTGKAAECRQNEEVKEAVTREMDAHRAL